MSLENKSSKVSTAEEVIDALSLVISTIQQGRVLKDDLADLKHLKVVSPERARFYTARVEQFCERIGMRSCAVNPDILSAPHTLRSGIVFQTAALENAEIEMIEAAKNMVLNFKKTKE